MTNPSDIIHYEIPPDGKYEWALNALDVLASMRTFQDIVNKQDAKAELYAAARIFISQLVTMNSIAFMEVNDVDKSFVITDCTPKDKTDYVQTIINEQIQKGTFAWAIQQNKILTISLDEQGETLLLHALVTPLGVKGMFVGILDYKVEKVNGVGLDTVSVIIQNLASSLDTYFSKQLISNYNQQLEVLIKYRTRELEEAKKLAEAANIAKSDFLAGMSHELNTPFNIIFGYLDLMMEDLEGVKKEDPRYAMREDLNKIIFATKSLNKMVCNIIYLAKLEAGRIKIGRSGFQLKEMLLKINQVYEGMVSKNNNTLRFDFCSEHEVIENDEPLVEIVLNHLLDNACKFTVSGTIEVVVTDSEINGRHFVKISIIDTGIGIADEDLSLLFSNFTQVDSSDRKRFDGLGLGLSITKRVCDLIGASLEVESKPGIGSKFTIALPL